MLQIKDLGSISYQPAWDYQEKLHAEIVEQISIRDISEIDSYFLFCEHPHVYTLGKSGSENNMLMNFMQLQSIQAEFVKTNRGGDITYHGPGQIVGYPIIYLKKYHLGVKDYVNLLEEVIILTLAEYGIAAERLAGATGVWLDANSKKARKICAVGVRYSRWVTMHGFALNVNTDLNFFKNINPCGFTDKAVTSMSKELGLVINTEEVKEKIQANFKALLQEK
jgi:lipoyl(octanoyl) transferase